MSFFFSPPPKESPLARCVRLLITVIAQTCSFHILNCFLLSQFRQILVFHKISLCYIIIFSLEILYHKIYNGCVFCFMNVDAQGKNDLEDERLLVTSISYEIFLMTYHYYRICSGVKGVFTVLWDVFMIMEMAKSMITQRGASTILFVVALYNLPDSLLSLVCILRSDTVDSVSTRSRRYPKLEVLYGVVYAGTNIGLCMTLLETINFKQWPPILLIVGYFFKILSTSLVLNFIVMVLRRRYLAAITSFFKQLFSKTIRLEINYHEYYDD